MWSGEGANRLHYMIQIAHNYSTIPRVYSSDNVQNECRDAVLRNRRDSLMLLHPRPLNFSDGNSLSDIINFCKSPVLDSDRES